MDREASWYCQAHARPDSITIYSSVPYKAQSNSLEKYMSCGNKEADGVIAETPLVISVTGMVMALSLKVAVLDITCHWKDYIQAKQPSAVSCKHVIIIRFLGS